MKIDFILSYTASLIQFSKIDIIQTALPGKNSAKLEI